MPIVFSTHDFLSARIHRHDWSSIHSKNVGWFSRNKHCTCGEAIKKITDPSIRVGEKARSGNLGLGKVYYFTFLAAASGLLPILSLYYEQRGLSSEQIGFLASIQFPMT
ncbi:MAG: hypothetical protein JXA97_14195 [Anaerolineales bacterium]|nr:hypothetical protein [Anaerolineales bacterium]